MDKRTLSFANKFNTSIGEFPINLEKFVKEIFECAKKCVFLSADYGEMKKPRKIKC